MRGKHGNYERARAVIASWWNQPRPKHQLCLPILKHFFKMLTAQIQNQDPMNPIDSSDYATQLATFSSVEQQVLANSYLENIQNALSSSSLASVADWIGKSAKVDSKL